jgi:hypothetical protein
LLIGAPGTSLSAGVPGSLLGAKAPVGSPQHVLPQESHAFRSNQQVLKITYELNQSLFKKSFFARNKLLSKYQTKSEKKI